ncbi:hypothetical protein POSPLADRAFT_1043391 [Postia placenta MAD-698-R-SB12]|uniref:F-box domain-containing protein n=1 Tax=Postia placenta MAD-698-R-SB12 TaxID=670580 RepID=A0A1X6NBA1_9APHY|nr:hypothetical protein POSPLADRAFT_1043391 [Postia placenta MAD-698-R-SB12]OSX65800.1 hypothetical protein POSPLADRAFT_1043391 [Postia placenta MAD-698-R-SB12]
MPNISGHAITAIRSRTAPHVRDGYPEPAEVFSQETNPHGRGSHDTRSISDDENIRKHTLFSLNVLDRTAGLAEHILTMVRQVPPEIWWLVIDCLGEAREYKTLINCMLVNRRWHERSTKYLSHVIFDSQNSVASLALSRGQYIGRRWAGPSRVSIVGEGARVDQRTLIQHLGTFAQMLAGRWTQVNSLVIERAKLSVSMLPSICLNFAAWDSISTLVLRNVEFPTAAMLTSLLNSLPGLCDLTCGDVLFAEQPRRSPRELHAQIGTLTMSSIQLDPDDHCANHCLMYLSRAATFLSGVTSDDISLITLDFHLPDTGTPEQIRAIAEGLVINGFPKIDEVLSRPIFATLQRVFMSAIQPTRTRMPTEYRPNWELYLPNLVERDLVWYG